MIRHQRKPVRASASGEVTYIIVSLISGQVITFRVSRRRCKMYIGHARLCVYLSVCPRPHAYITARTTVTWGDSRGRPLVVHYLADLQSVHGCRCYDKVAPNAKCQRVLVLALYLVSNCSLYVTYTTTRSSAVTEGPRDALCQSKSCELLHSCTN